MLGFRRFPVTWQARFVKMRELYHRHFGENTREARGLRLLRGWLSPCQRAQFDANGHFDVVGCVSGRRYRIHYGAAMNVHELDQAGRLRAGWCFVPEGPLVAGDVMLAQKIALETSESSALSVAKRFVPSDRSGPAY